MADRSSIEWTDATWNPVRGCTRVSPGCGGGTPGDLKGGCYAEKIAGRFSGPGMAYESLAEMRNGVMRWTGKLRLVEDVLLQPLRWKRPRRIFVNSMSDLFHEALTDAEIDRVFAVMALASQHTFQVLTKRSARMLAYCADAALKRRIIRTISALNGFPPEHGDTAILGQLWPLPNVWLGVSAEDQTRADERVPDLLATPAAVRFVSAEPLLGPIDFTRLCPRPVFAAMPRAGVHLDGLRGRETDAGHVVNDGARVDWIIVGGESGPGARLLWTPNVRSIVRQCAAAGVACFVKQLGANVQDRNDAGFDGEEAHHWPDVDPDRIEHDLDGYRDHYQGAPVRIHLRSRKGGDPSEWPADLRAREMPGGLALTRLREVAHG